MCQCGPLWHIVQTHWMSVDSDLSRLNEWLQWLETAMIRGDERAGAARKGKKRELALQDLVSRGCKIDDPLL